MKIFDMALGTPICEAALSRRGRHYTIQASRVREKIRECGDNIGIGERHSLPCSTGVKELCNLLIAYRLSHDRYHIEVATGIVEERAIPIIIHEWRYNFGPNRLMRYLRFENGILKAIESIGRGY
jgi:hypothetical protein